MSSQGSFRHAAMRLQRAHWARATTWAISFWAIDRPSEPQRSSWSYELDSGHTLHGSIPGGCIERSRRFLSLTGPVCRSGRDESRAGFSDLFVGQASGIGRRQFQPKLLCGRRWL
jgi:hypothetical protein